jgi:hypothetical protein
MMKQRHTALLTLMMCFAMASLLPAQTTAPISEAAVGEDSNEQPKSRDPFWPVGWKPAPKVVDEGGTVGPTFKPKWAAIFRSIQVTSIVETFNKGEYIATVKGFGVVEKGDVLSVKLDGYIYQVLIDDITNKGIVPAKKSVAESK